MDLREGQVLGTDVCDQAGDLVALGRVAQALHEIGQNGRVAGPERRDRIAWRRFEQPGGEIELEENGR